jgi:hypothetical protein
VRGHGQGIHATLYIQRKKKKGLHHPFKVWDMDYMITYNL